MGLSTVLKAKTREVKSSNLAGRLRAEGFLPAVFYGPGVDTALSLCLNYNDFKNAMLGSEGNRSLYTLEIEGEGQHPVLLKDYQIDPISRKAIHADFYKVDMGKTVTVKVPVTLKGKPAGVEKGGQLQLGAREVTVTALPDKVPAELVIDISHLGLGQAMHFSQVPSCEDFKISYNVDLTVATVAIPKGMKTEQEAEAAGEAAAPAKKGKK